MLKNYERFLFTNNFKKYDSVNYMEHFSEPKKYNDADDKKMDEIINNTLLLEHALNPKVPLFIKNYLTYHNLADAARASRLDIKEARRIINKADVQDTIKAITSKWAKTTGFDSNELLERVNEVSVIDPADLFNFDGTIKDLHSIPRSLTRAIKKIRYKEFTDSTPEGDIKTGRIIDIEFHDKLKATELLGKNLSLFKDELKVTHDIGKNMSDVLIKNAEERMKSIDHVIKDALPLPINNTIPIDATPIDEKVIPIWKPK